MLELIIAPSGLGKTKYILNDIKVKKDSNKIIIITPDQNSYNFEKLLCEELGATFNIDVVNFARLSRKLSTLIGSDVVPLKETNKYFYYLELINRFEGRDNFLINRLMQDFDFINVINDLIDELNEYDVESIEIREFIDTLDDTRDKFEDIVELYTEYKAILLENMEYSEQTYIENIIAGLEHTDLSEYVFYIDGYYNFSPLEYKLIEVFIKKSNKVSLSCISELDKYTNFKLEKLVKQDLIEEKTYNFLSLKDVRDTNKYALDIYRKSHEIIAYINSILIRNKLFKFEIVTFYSEEKNKNYKIHLEVNRNIITEIQRNKYEENRYVNDELYYLQKELSKNSKSYKETRKNNISIYEAPNIELEMKQLARNISRERIENKYNLKDIAILYRDEVYENFEYILRDFGINLHIDKEINVSNHRLIKLIKNILNYDDKSFKYSILNIIKNSSVDLKSILMKGGNLTTEDIEIILNNKLVNKIQDLDKKYFIKPSQGYTSQELSFVKTFLQDLAYRLNQLKKGKKISKYVKNIFGILEWLNVEEKIIKKYEVTKISLKQLEEKNKNQQIFDKIIDLLKSINEKRDTRLDYIRFKKIMFILLDKIVYRTVPRSDDYIIMSKIDLSKVENKKIIFIVGLNKDILPKSLDSTGIIDDSDKHALSLFGIELSPSSKVLMIDEDFVAYIALTRAREKLYISYSKLNSKYQLQNASIYIDMVYKILNNNEENTIKKNIETEIFFDIEKIHKYVDNVQYYSPLEVIYLYKKLKYTEKNLDISLQEDLNIVKKTYSDIVEKINKKFIFNEGDIFEKINSVKSKEEKYSFSKLKLYEMNPLIYFIETILNISQEKDFGLSPVLLGSYKHAILEDDFLIAYIKSKVINYRETDIDIDHLRRYIDSLHEEIETVLVKIITESKNRDIKKFINIIDSEEINSYIYDKILKDIQKTVSIEIYYHILTGYSTYKKEEKFELKCSNDSIELVLGERKIKRDLKAKYQIEEFILSGIIDRLDEKDGDFIVIDYKSSKTDFNVESFYNKEISQLLVYMLAILLLRNIEIGKIKGIFYRELAKSNKPNADYRLRGLVNEDLLKDLNYISEFAFIRTKKDGSAYASDQHKVYKDVEFEKLVDINIKYLYNLVEKIQKSEYNLGSINQENESLFNFSLGESVKLDKEYEKIQAKDFKKYYLK